MPAANVRSVSGEEARALVPALADILVDCVEGGASVSFMFPLSRDEAAAFWTGVAGAIGRGEASLIVAEHGGGPCGTVILAYDMPRNQPHRADLRKLLVHRRARRQGIGEALMQAAEREALARGRPLLVLDTASGDAERLYERLGWTRVGSIPDYALWPQGGLCATTFFYKKLV